MDILSAVITLLLIMDPLGNIPLFLAALRPVPPERRRRVLIREIAFAYMVLLANVFLGSLILRLLGLEEGMPVWALIKSVAIAGGK